MKEHFYFVLVSFFFLKTSGTSTSSVTYYSCQECRHFTYFQSWSEGKDQCLNQESPEHKRCAVKSEDSSTPDSWPGCISISSHYYPSKKQMVATQDCGYVHKNFVRCLDEYAGVKLIDGKCIKTRLPMAARQILFNRMKCWMVDSSEQVDSAEKGDKGIEVIACTCKTNLCNSFAQYSSPNNILFVEAPTPEKFRVEESNKSGYITTNISYILVWYYIVQIGLRLMS